MTYLFTFLFSIIIIFHLFKCNEEDCAKNFLKYLDEKASARANKVSLAGWTYECNITNANKKRFELITDAAAKSIKEDQKDINKFKWKIFQDESVRRQMQFYGKMDEAALPEDKYSQLQEVIHNMVEVYSTAKICPYDQPGNHNLSLEPDIADILKLSTNTEELKHVWVEWRNAIGPNVKEDFQQYVILMNEAAQLNNFADAGEMWLYDYESENIKEQVEQLWQQVKPLYLQLHAYIRLKLWKQYGDIVSKNGPIPVHLLGNMWGQSWISIQNFTLPYPEKLSLNIDNELNKQGYSVNQIFKTAEHFYTSLQFPPLNPSFWKNSVIEKPNDNREIVCHPSAWDFNNREDFRIKQCTRVDGESFETVHHEMGHVVYFMAYKDQPYIFRNGANGGFHEAIGDLISLSVMSRKHLLKLNLSHEEQPDEKEVLNNLFLSALVKIPFLPFGYLVDLWRWDVFSGKTKPENYNCDWWKLRHIYQGVEPPVDRSEHDFDPAAKYHVSNNSPYFDYFVACILQFQFHKALCTKAGEYGSKDSNQLLHECDIFGSNEAGMALNQMLQLGRSKPWPEALKVLTGQDYMDATAILEYFDPLLQWLKIENQKSGAYIGWEQPSKTCK